MNGGILDASAIPFSPVVASLSGGQGSVRLGANVMLLGNSSSADSFNGTVYSTGGITKTGTGMVTTVNCGGITFTNTVAANTNYLETFGDLTLGSGAFNVVLTSNQTGVNNSQRLSFASFTRSGPASTAAFSGTLNGTTSRIQFVGSTPSATGEIIGPWATTGATATTQTDYTRFDASGNIIAAAFSSVADDSTWTTTYSAAGNFNLSGATNLSNTRIINTLRYSGAAATLGLGANDLQTYGILSAGASLLTIAGTGSVSTPAGGGNLFFIGGSSTATNGITVSAPITRTR